MVFKMILSLIWTLIYNYNIVININFGTLLAILLILKSV